jgi:hypothetical protein
VDTAGLREAYAALVTEASRGGFGAPDDGGWSAERVVAHVSVNDGLLTAVTERLLAGRDASLDNAPATDLAALDELVARLPTPNSSGHFARDRAQGSGTVEGRRPEQHDPTMARRRGLDPVEVDRPVNGLIRKWLAGIEVERLTAARSVQAEQPGRV